MKKQNKKEDMLSHGYGYVIHDVVPNRICGSLYEIVESLGMKDSQETALKNLIQKSVWDSINEKVLIHSELHDKIRDKYWELRKSEAGKNPDGLTVKEL